MQRDYILRIIEQFIQALAAIIKSRRSGNYEEAFTLIQNAARYYLDRDINELLACSPDQLLEHFADDRQRIDTEKCMICSDLLHELASICVAKGHVEASLRLKVMCLNLYLTAIPKDKQFQYQQYYKHVDTIIEELEGYPLPEDVVANLSAYHKFRIS